MRTIKIIFLFAAFVFTTDNINAQTAKKTAAEKNENTSGEVIVLTKKDFLEKIFNYEKNKDSFVYEGKLPCIIDFYADWCGPCRMVDPILKELAKEYKGKIIVYKINTDNERALAQAFRINSIPTYFFIPAKGDPQRSAGAMPRESFVKVITEFLLK